MASRASQRTASRRRRLQNDTCRDVLYVCDALQKVLDEPSFFTSALVVRGDGSDMKCQQICPQKIHSFTLATVRKIFPSMDECSERWKNISCRFSHLVYLAIECPHVLEVLKENRFIVRRSLFFSAKWFFASTSGYRSFAFKIFENLLLFSEVKKTALPSGSSHPLYSLPDLHRLIAAHQSMAHSLFHLSTS
jgi:hypothetical protein